MDQQPHVDAISLIGIGFTTVGLFLPLFFLLNKRKNDGYFYLYAILILIALELGFKTFVHSRLFLEFPSLFTPGRFFNLMLYPLFFLFIWAVTRDNPPKRIWFLLLLGPFIFYFVIRLGHLLFTPIDYKKAILSAFYTDARPGPFNYWSNMETMLKTLVIPLLFLLPMAYMFLKFILKSKEQPNRFLTWLLSMSILMYFLSTITFNHIYKWLFTTTKTSFIEWPVDIVFLTVMLILFALVALLVNTGSSLFPPIKYAKSVLGDDAYEKILKNVLVLLESEQLYLQQSLDIKTVADRLGTNSKYISQVINHKLGKSFTQLINGYRVEEAKQQLLNPKNEKLTLEAIGNTSGFHTKSSFFSTFKQFTGLTPSQFVDTYKK